MSPDLELAGLDVADESAVARYANRWGLLGLGQESPVQLALTTQPVPEELRASDVAPQMADRLSPDLELAALDLTDQSAIEEFLNRWGLLGLDQPVPEESNLPPAHRLRPQWTEVVSRGETPVFEKVVDAWLGMVSMRVNCAERAGPTIIDAYNVAYGRYYPKRFRILAQVHQFLEMGVYWNEYSEPLQEFVAAAREFQATFALYEKMRSKTKTFSYDDAYALEQLNERHLRHVAPAAVVRRPTRGATRRSDPVGFVAMSGWRFRSLLSACYMLLLLDANAGRRLRRCANESCRHPFSAGRADKDHCSENCRAAHEQVERRRRRPPPRSLQA